MATRYFRRAAGTARFAYNWALAKWQEKYQAGQKGITGFGLVKEFNSIKHQEFPWTSEVTKWAPQKSIQNLDDAFKRFFQKKSKYPRFKKKGLARDSFYLGVGAFSIQGKYLKVPKLGRVKMTQALRFPGTPKSVVVSREGEDWFASVQIELDETFVYPNRCETQASVGIDLGVKTLATLSDGTKIEPHRATKRYSCKLARAQRGLARKVKGSRNRAKARLQVSKIHLRIKRLRSDSIHKMTASVVKRFKWIGIEDLGLKGMVRNHKLAKSLVDMAGYEIKRQLEYKSVLAGSNVAVAARFYPSSKLCSRCGSKLAELKLEVREWICPACGACHDRDVNAAKNLEQVSLRHRETRNACGEDVRPRAHGAVRHSGK